MQRGRCEIGQPCRRTSTPAQRSAATTRPIVLGAGTDATRAYVAPLALTKLAPGVRTSTNTLAVDEKSAVAKFPKPSVPANTLTLLTKLSSFPPVTVTTIVGTTGLGVRFEVPPTKLRP